MSSVHRCVNSRHHRGLIACSLPCAILCSVFAASLAGCGAETDVTNAPQYGFAPLVGRCYTLRHAGWVDRNDHGEIELLATALDRQDAGPILASRQEIESEMQRYFYCQIASGTRLIIERMYYDGEREFRIVGHITSGPLAGQRVWLRNFRTYKGFDSWTFTGKVISQATALMPDPQLFLPCNE